MFYQLTRVSGNAKTGPIPVSTTSADTCPEACPFIKTCYAKTGPLRMHWDKVSAGVRGGTFEAFLGLIQALPRFTLWRHNQAGDLPGVGDTLDTEALDALVTANKGKRGFTYTHKPLRLESERQAVKDANTHGFTVNLSANTLEHADALYGLSIGPVVTVLSEDVHGNMPVHTPGGIRVVVCPATYREDVTCATCALCQRADRKVIVGFPVHGNGKGRYAEEVATV